MSELDQYDYSLPPELIAQRPLACRSDARLMVIQRRNRSIEHVHIRDLPELLRPSDCLVLNDTRVIPARLVGYRTRTGGRWQGLLLEHDNQRHWQVLGKTRGRLTAGETITLQDRQMNDGVRLRVLASQGQGVWVMQPDSDVPTLDLLQRFGRVPLPPYIRGGEMVDQDLQDYQTVFAERPGAVAAPTAGLHFTPALLHDLRQRRIGIARVTLHVGIGTFRPIVARSLSEHAMHSEWGQLDADCLEKLMRCRSAGGRIVAVGTTVVRVLETAARDGTLRSWQGTTDLFIRPPFQFRAVDALLTNFHLPKSSLLVLVRTFGGDDLIRRAYQEAIDQQYRFYSYGDAMLIV